jgi:hypothetical protein
MVSVFVPASLGMAIIRFRYDVGLERPEDSSLGQIGRPKASALYSNPTGDKGRY